METIDLEQDANTAPPSDLLDHIVSLATLQTQQEARIAQLKVELEQVTKALRQTSEVDLPQLLDQVGITQISLPSGKTVTVTEKQYPSINKANVPQAHKWLRENGFDAIIKRELVLKFGRGEDALANTVRSAIADLGVQEFSDKESVHPQTLGAFVREQLAKGTELPSSISINPVRATQITN